jgi:hypothetical protein
MGVVKNNFKKLKKYLILIYFQIKNNLKINCTIKNTFIFIYGQIID